ncbi:MAG: tetratricopeptide repeat protein [Bacteroidales bacterium]|nr:tetratricopeptide repeat protein [Bacteroidales bacterium]
MAGTGYIDLASLNMDELMGVVNLYPWFGSARKELCVRMSQLAGSGWGDNQFSEAALYIGSREIVSDLVRKAKTQDYSDKDVEALLKSFMEIDEKPQEEKQDQRPVRVVGGDFFTQDQYDKVRREEDKVFSHFASKIKSESSETPQKGQGVDFCTETLAEIYIEQGYYAQASAIYSKLILRYPEKSAYFASLIEKLRQVNQL